MYMLYYLLVLTHTLHNFVRGAVVMLKSVRHLRFSIQSAQKMIEAEDTKTKEEKYYVNYFNEAIA